MNGYHGLMRNLIRCLVVVLILRSQDGLNAEATQYRLDCPALHVALSTDISLEYTLSGEVENGFVQLYDVAQNEERNRKDLPAQTHGFLIYDCSLFDHVGIFEFRLYDEDYTLLGQSCTIDVQWPSVEFIHDRTHVAMTTGVTATMRVRTPVCGVLNYNRYETIVIVEYVGTNHSTAEQYGTPVAQYNTGQIQRVGNAEFECKYFDRAGLYQFVMLSSYGDYVSNESVIAISSFLQVQWSDNYHIHMQMPTIFPCDYAITVGYTTPACKSSDDKIRAFAQRIHSEHLAPQLEYSSERRVSADAESVDFTCEAFDLDSTIVGYCFKYVSITQTGAVHEQTQACVSNSLQEGPSVNGNWGGWSPWTNCPVTCGSGVLSRYRLCNDPAPMNGGMGCQGERLDQSDCEGLNSCPAMTTGVAGNLPDDDDCSCGCKLLTTQGTIRSANLPCGQNAVWIISLSDGLKINLTFHNFDLDLSREWLKVRNGGSVTAPLIVYHTGNRAPRPVMSSRSQLYIEYKSAVDEPVPRTGFSASYSSFNYTTKPAPPLLTPSTGMSTENIVNSVVTVVGIAICGIIIITSIAFALHARARVQKKRRDRNMGLNSGEYMGHNMIDTSHGSASWNLEVSSTGQSLQRLFHGPTSSMSEVSTSTMRKMRDRSHLYKVAKENEELKPGIHYTSPYHDSSYTSISRKSNETPVKISSPSHSPKHPKKSRQHSRNASSPYHLGGRNGSLSGSSRHSSGRTDMNTTTLAIRTPEEYAVRGYSVMGSEATFNPKHVNNRADYRNSKSSREMKSSRHSDTSRPSMTSDANSAPYVNREGKLTPLGMAVARNMDDDLSPTKPVQQKSNQRDQRDYYGSYPKKREHGSGSGKRRGSDRDRSPGSRSGGSGRHRRYNDRDRTPPRESREHNSRGTRGRILPEVQGREAPRPAFYDHSHEMNGHHRNNAIKSPLREKQKLKRSGRSDKNAVRNISRMYRSGSSDTADGRSKKVVSPDPWQYRENNHTPQPEEEKHTQELLWRIRQGQPSEQFRLSYITSSESLPKNRVGGPRSPDSEGDVLSDPNPSRYNDPKPLERRTLSAGNTLRTTSPENIVPFIPSHVSKNRRPDTPSSRSRTSSGPGTPRRLHKHGQSDFSISQEEYEYDDYMPSLPGSYFNMEPVYHHYQDSFKPATPGYNVNDNLDSINANFQPPTI
ncbi:uncharacterized protein LOC102807554 [Saccoglossus kowalevskii]|uniref:Uncharacterized protein LOC102807554 n=1 Tax=Saccoglossus kowalevskii TaxID=10224 RepID=A0ABM0M0S8_SACKO|nr:PREDICTED: uncharacterized protein LOC102807554 [Saccoglossus kowalevskii]